MKVNQLRNYGKPLKIPEGVPADVEKRVRKEALKIIRKNIGWLNTIRLLFLTFSENRRMQAQGMSVVRERGLTDEKFLKGQIQMAAVFSATSRIVGKERALEISKEIMNAAGPAAMSSIMPEPEHFKQVGDPFEAFKQYYMAVAIADKEAGIHEFEVIEDGADAFQVNVTYCAYCEIPRQLGVVEACQPSCYADEVFFPDFCDTMGMRFIRKGTLARGDKVCDFRYERVGRR